MTARTLISLLLMLVAGSMPLLASAAAEPASTPSALPPDMLISTLRMLGSLTLVLLLVAGGAWLLKRYRPGSRMSGGQIEIIGGLSLGSRERVVLLQVLDEQVLVGISQDGMRALHVLRSDQDIAEFQLPAEVSS